MTIASKNHAPVDPHGLVNACRELHTAVDALDAFAAEKLGIARNDLRCLNRLENGPVTAKAIATTLGLTTGSVTALLDRLEKKGLIQRKPHPTDRRGLFIHATSRAYQQLAPIYRRFGEQIAALSASYKKKEAEAAARHVSEIAKACRNVTDSFGTTPDK